MELVLAALRLAEPGGVQSYLLTVGPHLERLGHGVTLYSPALGAVAELARERGMRIVGDESRLPSTCDAVVSQDGVLMLELADRYPEARRAIVVHGADLDVHLPPALGVATVAVAMNDVTAARTAATADRPRVVRLRQPIDTARFAGGGSLPARPRHVLMLGNPLASRQRDEFAATCERAGLSWRQIGTHGEVLSDPREALREADIVVGQGRSLLEGMACGRAAWCFGPWSGDGWVTDESYAALEADGFRGRAGKAPRDARDFARSLANYHPSMGETNRALVLRHHSAYDHVVELVRAIDAPNPTRAPDAPLREMARMVRMIHDAQLNVLGLTRALAAAREHTLELDEQLTAERSQRERHGS